MDNSNLSRIEKNCLKNKIKEIINNYYKDELNYNIQENFNEIINDNIKNDNSIKNIIKILSFNLREEKNEKIKNKYYELYLILINKINRENTIKYLTVLLLFLQENIDNISIEIGFEKILNNLDKFKLKIFEILNGFCILNMKKKENTIQNKALLCYEILITNYDNCEKKNKNDILKSFLDNIKYNLESNIFIDKYSLLVCLNKIICKVQDKYDFVETIPYLLNYLLVNDYDIKLIVLKIINNIIKYNKEKSKELKEEIIKYINKIINEEYIDSNIKIIIDEIINSLDIKDEFNVRNKKINGNKSNYDNNNSGSIMEKNEINNKKDNNYENKLKFNLKGKKIESVYKKNKLKYKLNKKNNKDNLKIEIFVKKNPNKKIINRKLIDLNSNSLLEKRKENNSTTIIGNNSENKINKRNNFISTFTNEDDYLNPIKIWNKFDERNLTQINNRNRNKNINKINNINKKEQLNLELLINEIENFSKSQNLLTEKIFLLESNTYKKISYFNSRIEELENKLLNDSQNNNYENEEKIIEENIREENIREEKIKEEKIKKEKIKKEKFREEKISEENMKNYEEKQLIDYPYKIIYPSNSLSEKLIIFLNEKDNRESIRYLSKIREEQIIEIDNNLIEDIVNKLIYYLEKEIYIHESINFIKKIFIKNKIRFKLNTIKRLLTVLDILLKKNRILTEADSFDVSLIISSVKI